MAFTDLEKTILDTIAYFEGTIGRSQNGYDLLFGGTKVMSGWSTDTTIRHRCIKEYGTVTKKVIEDNGYTVCQDTSWEGKTSKGKTTTAAGRYQYLGYSWANTTKKLGLGFNAPMTKENQNKAAIRGVKVKRKVTEQELKNALDSLANFKIVAEKLKEEWTSFKASLAGTYPIKIDVGWQFYKSTYEKYKGGSGSATQSNFSSAGSMLFYLDKDGKSTSEFGNNKISSNGDTTKFYYSEPNQKTDKIIYFWAGLESVISRKAQWNQIPKSIKDNYYIVMAAGTVSNQQNPIGNFKTVVEGFNSSLKVDKLQKVLMGYSAGGYSVFNNYDKSYKFVALMDPSLASTTNTEDRTYGNNVAMIWGSSGMKGISNWGTRYPKVQESIKNGGGFSQEITGLNHGVAIEKWFEKYQSNLVDAGSTNSSGGNDLGSSTSCTYTPTSTTGGGAGTIETINLDNISSSDAATGDQPNASYLRSVLAVLGYKEKYNTSIRVVPEKDPTTGEWKVKANGKYVNGQMSNGGDITKELAEVSAAILTKIKEIYPTYKIQVTGGNDAYHQGLSYNSRHKSGRGLDIVIEGEKSTGNCTTDPNYGKVSKNGTKVQNVIQIIRGFSGGLFDKVRYIDEYCGKSSAATGDHIHFSWGSGTEGQKVAKASKKQVDQGQLSTYGSQDLFS